MLGLCALITVCLLVWPSASAAPLPRPAAEHYSGPNIEMRRSGPVSKFPLRLVSPNAVATATPKPIEAVPVLVGVAGRRAYLRSTVTGEVEGVTVGASIDGWRLVSVSARTATLRGTGGDKRVEMFATPTAAPSGVPDVSLPAPVPTATLLMPAAPTTGG